MLVKVGEGNSPFVSHGGGAIFITRAVAVLPYGGFSRESPLLVQCFATLGSPTGFSR